uniref:NR LBD domain-containing protein n=1 Tax=Panagrolaimus sp. ES5 TaxID=591445 RepID=A0AC34GV98_9BILA
MEEFEKLMSNFMEITKPQQTPALMADEEFRIKCIKTSYVNIAQMLLAFTPFSNLPFKEKIILHHEFWQIFIELGKCYQTCQYLGSNSEDARSFADFHQYRDYEKEINDSDKSKNNSAANFMTPLKAKLIAAVKGFKKFNPTFFEFSLICQVLLWSRCDILNLSASTIKLAETITNQLWDSLHFYYVNELKLEAYAARQAKLYRMINITSVILDEEKQAFKAKDIFSFRKENVIPCCKFKHGYFNYIKNKSLL